MLCVSNGIKKYWSDQNTLAKSFFKESVKSAYCGFKEANLSFNSSRFFTRDSIDTSVPAVISISKKLWSGLNSYVVTQRKEVRKEGWIMVTEE